MDRETERERDAEREIEMEREPVSRVHNVLLQALEREEERGDEWVGRGNERVTLPSLHSLIYVLVYS